VKNRPPVLEKSPGAREWRDSCTIADSEEGAATDGIDSCFQHLLAYLMKSNGSQLLKVNCKSKAKVKPN